MQLLSCSEYKMIIKYFQAEGLINYKNALTTISSITVYDAFRTWRIYQSFGTDRRCRRKVFANNSDQWFINVLRCKSASQLMRYWKFNRNRKRVRLWNQRKSCLWIKETAFRTFFCVRPTQLIVSFESITFSIWLAWKWLGKRIYWFHRSVSIATKLKCKMKGKKTYSNIL